MVIHFILEGLKSDNSGSERDCFRTAVVNFWDLSEIHFCISSQLFMQMNIKHVFTIAIKFGVQKFCMIAAAQSH